MPLASDKYNTCVIYVSRYADGLFEYQRFMRSLWTQDNKNFSLFVVFKGFPDKETIERWIGTTDRWHSISFTSMKDYGFDLTAYRIAAASVRSNRLLFFNTSSELVNSKCVETLEDGLLFARLVGAFGSWETYKSKLFWKPFPNYHIRTNAFAIRREDFLSVWPKRFYTKFGCHLWESGKKGFSTKFQHIVANAERYVCPTEYNISGFRYNNSLLLAQDNRSRQWDELSKGGQQLLLRSTWIGM